MTRSKKAAPGHPPTGDVQELPKPAAWETLALQLAVERLEDPSLLARAWLSRMRGDGRTCTDVAREYGVEPGTVRAAVLDLLEKQARGSQGFARTVLVRMALALSIGRELHDDDGRELPPFLKRNRAAALAGC